MYEPKYKLNRRDRDRLHALITRHAVNGPWRKRPSRKYPPLSADEELELTRLEKKQRRKIWSHPKMQKAQRHARYLTRKAKMLCAKIQAFIAASGVSFIK